MIGSGDFDGGVAEAFFSLIGTAGFVCSDDVELRIVVGEFCFTGKAVAEVLELVGELSGGVGLAGFAAAGDFAVDGGEALVELAAKWAGSVVGGGGDTDEKSKESDGRNLWHDELPVEVCGWMTAIRLSGEAKRDKGKSRK